MIHNRSNGLRDCESNSVVFRLQVRQFICASQQYTTSSVTDKANVAEKAFPPLSNRYLKKHEKNKGFLVVVHFYTVEKGIHCCLFDHFQDCKEAPVAIFEKIKMMYHSQMF